MVIVKKKISEYNQQQNRYPCFKSQKYHFIMNYLSVVEEGVF